MSRYRVLIALVACGWGLLAVPAPTSEPHHQTLRPVRAFLRAAPGWTPNWSGPVPFGVPVDPVAPPRASFTSIPPPAGWGAPAGAFAPSATDPSHNYMLAWTWSDSGGGPRYYLQERSAGATTQDQLDAAATCSASETGCDATAFSIVTLSDGRSALLVQAPDVASLVWVEEGVELTLVGPGATFTPAIAEGLAAEI